MENYGRITGELRGIMGTYGDIWVNYGEIWRNYGYSWCVAIDF